MFTHKGIPFHTYRSLASTGSMLAAALPLLWGKNVLEAPCQFSAAFLRSRLLSIIHGNTTCGKGLGALHPLPFWCYGCILLMQPYYHRGKQIPALSHQILRCAPTGRRADGDDGGAGGRANARGRAARGGGRPLHARRAVPGLAAGPVCGQPAPSAPALFWPSWSSYRCTVYEQCTGQ